jgi:hypothetical protein
MSNQRNADPYPMKKRDLITPGAMRMQSYNDPSAYLE